MALALQGFEKDHPVSSVLVECTVSDEMQDLILVPAELPLKRLERRSLQAVHNETTFLHDRPERLVQLRPFAFHIEGRIAGWARDQAQHPQRRLGRQRVHPLGQVHVSNYRRLGRQTEESVGGAVVEELPRDVGQTRGRPQAEPDPKTPMCPVGFVHAPQQACADRTGEHRLKQIATE
jgi:hypothetical protein